MLNNLVENVKRIHDKWKISIEKQRPYKEMIEISKSRILERKNSTEAILAMSAQQRKKVNELEDKSIKIIEMEAQRENTLKKESIHALLDNIALFMIQESKKRKREMMIRRNI